MNLKALYEKWNKDAKNFAVVYVSGDSDQNGFQATMDGMPWFAIPFKADASAIEAKVPCTGYPTPGVVKKDGEVLEADAFGKVDDNNIEAWLAKC